MRRGGIMLLVLAMAFGAGCGSAGAEPPEGGLELADDSAPAEPPEGELELAVDGRPLEAIWEDNASVEALKALAVGGLELTAEPYGGFEQVAALPERIVRDDRQTTAQPGDIMLYNGGSIVLFYGSNSWSYTRLGRISGLDEAELAELFGGGGVTLTLSVPS